MVKQEQEKALATLRHSTSHIMAQAVEGLFPGTKLAIGPSIEDGFYYDFDSPHRFVPEDLARIEEKMRTIIAEDRPFIRQELPREDAQRFFSEQDEPYKVELLQDITDQVVSLYRQGDFVDLCKGPHLESTGKVQHFKLLSLAGAYWRGDEKRQQLQRIYGTAFPTAQELEDYLKNLEEAKRRDHRHLGKELDFFSIEEDAGAGLIFWHPRGGVVRKIIEDYWKEEHLRNGYQLIYIPHIMRLELWKTSGHWDFYRDYMYSPIDIEGQQYVLKPMNCPGHILIYKTHLHSYREMPIRYAELGTVYRYEKSGVLHGLLRVRGFTQDDAHIFCRKDQLAAEIRGVLDFTLKLLRTFGFSEYEIRLSTRPEKFVGTVESWQEAENALRSALESSGLTFTIDPGEGVFYGPKIDLKIKDTLGRSWQCSTIQVDFNLPERFDVTYRNDQGKDEPVIMVHRALMGSLERFFGVLLEHYAAAFPLWLAPEQIAILTITDQQISYGQELATFLADAGIRLVTDFRGEKINAKIREAIIKKIPYLAIIGSREMNERQITLRTRSAKQELLSWDGLLQHLQTEIKNKR